MKTLKPPTTPCRHCGRVAPHKCRRLCWPCYYRPGVRERYPPTSKYYGQRCVGDSHRDPPLAPTPTTARPGTEAKLAVMAERARLGQAIFHPDDA